MAELPNEVIWQVSIISEVLGLTEPTLAFTRLFPVYILFGASRDAGTDIRNIFFHILS